MEAISILVVDDEPGIALLCERVLNRAGYDVTSETDPRRALEQLQQRRVDLLLVDIRMPEVDGFDVISRAQVVQPDVAVLVMTGFGTVVNGDPGFAAGGGWIAFETVQQERRTPSGCQAGAGR
jgi:DNA-binding NtrC family response regulator